MADSHINTHYYMLVLLLIYCGTHSLVYQVLPSSQYSCQTQPCLTLSQFASDISSYLQSNTTLTLIFQPGNHILNVTLRVESALSLQLSSILTLNASSVVCVQSRLELFNVTSVYVAKLKFIGCSVRSELIDHFLIEDAMFFGQKKSSSALELIRSTAIVNSSSFFSNMVGNLKPVMLRKIKNHAVAMAYVGGAVLLTQSNVVIIQSLFKQNSAEIGGAIFCEGHGNVTVINTTFERNRVTTWHNATVCYGGAVYCQHGCYLKLENSTFDSNKAVGRNVNNGVFSGGAVAAVGPVKLDINDCIFIDNEATSDGGAVYIWKGTVSINSTVFDDNYVDGCGGAIYLEGSGLSIMRVIENITKSDKLHGESISSKSLMNQSQFNNVTALDDKATEIKDLDTLMVITLSQFTGNGAYFMGGAICASYCAVDIIWSDFDDNTAYTEQGGVFSGSVVIITVTESEFSNNVAEKDDGGAFHTLSSIFIINRSKFTTSEGTRGGVLSCWNNSTVIINMSVFDGNIGSDGGAIFVSTGALSIHWGEFSHNEARYDGGALHTYMASVNITRCGFTFNEAGSNGGAVRLQNILSLIHI